jgi:hypothetical protein
MATTSERTLRITEKAFQAQIVELAKLYGWLHYHVHNARNSPAGWPDLVLVRPPHALFVEVKTDTGRLTPAQRTWLDALQRCPGVEAHVWRPGDWDAIVKRLKVR